MDRNTHGFGRGSRFSTADRFGEPNTLPPLSFGARASMSPIPSGSAAKRFGLLVPPTL